MPELLKAVVSSDDYFDRAMTEIYESFGALPAALGHHLEFLPTGEYTETLDHPPFHGSDEERARHIAELEAVASGKISYSEAAPFINGSWEHPGLVAAAIAKGEDLYLPMLNVPNDGALPQLPEGNIIEAPGVIKNGVFVTEKNILLPDKAAVISTEQSNIAEMIAAAAVRGDRKLAHEIINADSAIPADKKDQAHRALDKIIEQHLDLMPQFKI
jgi:alpha-galactosidase/6-phospho-beta-glucosidase family protein